MKIYIVEKRSKYAEWKVEPYTKEKWDSAWDNADYRTSKRWGMIQSIARWFRDHYFFLVEADYREEAVRHAQDWMEEYYDK